MGAVLRRNGDRVTAGDRRRCGARRQLHADFLAPAARELHAALDALEAGQTDLDVVSPCRELHRVEDGRAERGPPVDGHGGTLGLHAEEDLADGGAEARDRGADLTDLSRRRIRGLDEESLEVIDRLDGAPELLVAVGHVHAHARVGRDAVGVLERLEGFGVAGLPIGGDAGLEGHACGVPVLCGCSRGREGG